MNKDIVSFFGILSTVAVGCFTAGILGYLHEKRKTEKAKQDNLQTFREVYEDNAPEESSEDDYERAFNNWY